MEQFVCYKTLKWSSSNGEMGFDNYAIAPNERGTGKPRWWIRRSQDAKTTVFSGGDLVCVSDPKLIEGKTLVTRLPGVLAFNEFKDDAGVITREATTTEKFERYKTVKDEPPPTKGAGTVKGQGG